MALVPLRAVDREGLLALLAENDAVFVLATEVGCLAPWLADAQVKFRYTRALFFITVVANAFRRRFRLQVCDAPYLCGERTVGVRFHLEW